MRRNGLISLIVIVLITVGGLGYTFASDNEPLLGLDLQGGVSVVYQPANEGASDDAFDQAIQIIRQRVDSTGTAEPEIARQGDSVIVQLPGVDDPQRVLDLIGQTAELRFRPVLESDNGFSAILEGSTEDPDAPTSTIVGDDTTDTTVAPESTDTTVADEQGFSLVPGENAAPLFQTDETTTTEAPDTPASTVPEDTTASTVPDDTTASTVPGDETDLSGLLGGFEVTPVDEDIAENIVVLPLFGETGEERLRLGPAFATGEIVTSARAEIDGFAEWSVSLTLDSEGGRAFDVFASECFNRTQACPTGRLAITLDGRVESAPNVNSPNFGGSLVISGNFSEGEAKDLALVLRYGSLPVELVAQDTRQVSATIGKDALNAGITAGIVGLIVVAVYMIVYYRLLGVVAVLSLLVSASLLWIIVAYIGANNGLALTLAGVTGIIVSIGVAVDSNVVFYEHLKEDVSRGRSMRSAVDGSFSSAFSTIIKADVASLIGAGVLYFLTVGPVRGFAFYLGLSTLLDLVSSYFFMRPLTLLLVKSKRLQDKPRTFGMPRPVGEMV